MRGLEIEVENIGSCVIRRWKVEHMLRAEALPRLCYQGGEPAGRLAAGRETHLPSFRRASVLLCNKCIGVGALEGSTSR